MAYLEIQGLTKSFTAHQAAVEQVSFTMVEGEIICLLGPSGCGKTTLLRLIAGLEPPDAGEVLLQGRSLRNVSPHQRGFGLMFQDFALFPHKNVFENVAFGLQMQAESPTNINRRVDEILARVDLQGYEQRDISQLSGGEQQRVALARSLAPGPRLLLLDEPLGALDRALRERLMLDLRTILKQVGVTAITVTHDQTEAFAIADRVAVMNRGRIEQLDTPQTVFNRPAGPFVAQFLGFENLLAGRMTSPGMVETGIGALRVPGLQQAIGTAVNVLIRPDAATVTDEGQLRGAIQAISFRGRYYQVWVEVAGERLMFELLSTGAWKVGSQVGLRLDQDRVMGW